MENENMQDTEIDGEGERQIIGSSAVQRLF